MGRRSTLSRLPTALRAAVDDALREGSTIEEIVALLRTLGQSASRSAVGRYAKEARQITERTDRAREISRVLVGRLGDDPEGKMSRGIGSMLQSMIFDYLAPTVEGAIPQLKPSDFMAMARALKDLVGAEKTATETALKVGIKAIETTGKKSGLSKEVISQIKAEFLGILS